MNLWIKSNTTSEIEITSHSKQHKLTNAYLTELNNHPVLLLDDQGFIQEYSQSVDSQFGYRRSELLRQHISCVIPQLSEVELIMEGHLNPLLNYICHCDHVFEALNSQSDIIICNLKFVRIENNGRRLLRLIVRPYDEVEEC
jgi:PAS domain S-box-containing protein